MDRQGGMNRLWLRRRMGRRGCLTISTNSPPTSKSRLIARLVGLWTRPKAPRRNASTPSSLFTSPKLTITTCDGRVPWVSSLEEPHAVELRHHQVDGDHTRASARRSSPSPPGHPGRCPRPRCSAERRGPHASPSGQTRSHRRPRREFWALPPLALSWRDPVEEDAAVLMAGEGGAIAEERLGRANQQHALGRELGAEGPNDRAGRLFGEVDEHVPAQDGVKSALRRHALGIDEVYPAKLNGVPDRRGDREEPVVGRNPGLEARRKGTSQRAPAEARSARSLQRLLADVACQDLDLPQDPSPASSMARLKGSSPVAQAADHTRAWWVEATLGARTAFTSCSRDSSSLNR